MIEKLGFTKMRNFCSGTDNVHIRRRPARDQKNIFAKDTSDKGLLASICKELLKLNVMKKWAKDLNRPLTKEGIQMGNKHMKNASYYRSSGKLRTVRYNHTPVRMAKTWNTDNSECWQGCEATETLTHRWVSGTGCKTVQPLGKTH